MSINTISLAEKMTGELDKAVVQKSVTGFLADNTMRAKFVGAKTVLIPNMELSGLGTYDRDTGFVNGSITVGNESYEMTMDRGRSFQLDREDNDESGATGLAGQVMGEFVRTRVVPELDAYCLSKLATIADDKEQTVGVADGKSLSDGVMALLTEAVQKVREQVGYDEELVAFVNGDVMNAMEETPEIDRHIDVSDFTKGEIAHRVRTYNGVPILPVPNSRMKSAFNFLDGSSDGETDGGFEPADGAKNIGLLIMPKRAASLIKKTETVRVFDPSMNLHADAWKFDYRLYYDVFLKNSLANAVYAYLY